MTRYHMDVHSTDYWQCGIRAADINVGYTVLVLDMYKLSTGGCRYLRKLVNLCGVGIRILSVNVNQMLA